LELVYSELHPDRSSAFKRERQLKCWSRAKKLALITVNSAELKRLAQCHAVRPPAPPQCNASAKSSG
jgi:predicted GIY-YIG superfamily endonuclease